MKTNNYTTNPDHPDIEIEIYWDRETAATRFEETFEELEPDIYRVKTKNNNDFAGLHTFIADGFTISVPTAHMNKILETHRITKEDYEKYLENVLIYSPLHLTITIAYTPFNLSDFWEDEYEYNRERIAKAFESLTEQLNMSFQDRLYITTFLLENLPELPEYN